MEVEEKDVVEGVADAAAIPDEDEEEEEFEEELEEEFEKEPLDDDEEEDDAPVPEDGVADKSCLFLNMMSSEDGCARALSRISITN